MSQFETICPFVASEHLAFKSTFKKKKKKHTVTPGGLLGFCKYPSA